MTEMLFENKFFLDSRSHIGYDKATMLPHLYLFGADKTIQRVKVITQGDGICNECRKHLDSATGEWDHIQGGRGAAHCDCLHNAQWLCHTCHDAKHSRNSRWSKQETARKEFSDLYKETT